MILEIALILTTATACLARYTGAVSGTMTLVLVIAVIALASLHVFARPMRWQLYPVWLLAAALLSGALFGIEPQGVGRHALAVASALLLFVSAALALGLPTPRLPAPSGPHAVGVSELQLTREHPATVKRQLTLKIWYPAVKPDQSQRPEALWSEFRRPDVAPALLRFLLGYLTHVPTLSFPKARAATPPLQGFPILIYSHGAVSIAGETTLLMEALASAGYIVVAIRHTDQAAEMQAIQASVPEDERQRDRALTQALQATTDRETRARLSRDLFANSTGMPRIIDHRAGDVTHVIDNLRAVASAIPQQASDTLIDPGRIGAFGLSLGGAVSMAACERSAQCAAVANLDGGLFGDPPSQPVDVPHLMLYSAASLGSNDQMLDRSSPFYSEAELPGSKHLDLHDVTLIAPILRWTGVLGRTSGRAAIAARNRIVLDFFDEAMAAKASARSAAS